MRTNIIIVVLIALFSFSVNAQTKQEKQKPIVFDVSKTLSNVEKISVNQYVIQVKGTIKEKIEDNLYWFKDDSGEMKIKISNEILSSVGDYNAETIFYIFGTFRNASDKIMMITKIEKP